MIRCSPDSEEGHRRVDFLFAPPWRPPIVFEVDGRQHDVTPRQDTDRDEALAAIGLDVLRVPAYEVRTGSGPNLSAVAEGAQIPTFWEPDPEVFGLLLGPAAVTRAGLVLAEGLERQFLSTAGVWNLRLVETTGSAALGIRSLLELLAAVDELWAGYLAPSHVNVVYGDDQRLAFERSGSAAYSTSQFVPFDAADMVIVIEHDKGPIDALPQTPAEPIVLFRPCCLPVDPRPTGSEGRTRPVARDSRAIRDALHRVLTYVFAKKAFWESQEEATAQVLQGGDTVVLLPTGAGKSLIYQLAGLLMPGRTMVIDPIVALIEDQLGSLRRYGIDRAVGISRAVTAEGQLDTALDLVRSGDALFFFITPERLQQQSFRNALAGLMVRSPVNLAVIDEAHCVSEWGHDFRPAYLGLGATIKKTCRTATDQSPPVLGLTGTASRAVLRDCLIELGLDQGQKTAVIKPATFDRKELSFEVVQTVFGAQEQSLVSVLESLPERFNLPHGRFYRTRGRRANLGIVFCPWVNGEYGIVRVAEIAASQGLTNHMAMYSGKPPKGIDDDVWTRRKREAAVRFRAGDIVVMASTKAFGMGIDIPNIRYTVHFGIPASIEAYYQEAGRAGRDRQRAISIVMFSELDEARTRQYLADDVDSEDVRQQVGALPFSASDDVTRQLFFHLGSFPGEATELDSVRAVLEQIEEIGTPAIVKVTWRTDSQAAQYERAIYRLRQVGLVEDYLKEWSAKTFEIRLVAADGDVLDDAFLGYVERIQPGQREAWAGRIAELTPGLIPRERAIALCRLLINLLYATIERARRRALREVAALMRTGASDDVIRRRIDDYFREGDIAPVIEELLDASSVDMQRWLAAYEGLLAAEAGELRGTTSRYLESYPDHPGLLLGRSLAECLTGGDAYEFESSFRRALEVSSGDYGVSDPDQAEMTSWLIDTASRAMPSWAPMVWAAWLDLEPPRSPLFDAEVAVLKDEGRYGESVIVLAERTRRIKKEVEDLISILG